jgi:hypothetical protein
LFQATWLSSPWPRFPAEAYQQCSVRQWVKNKVAEGATDHAEDRMKNLLHWPLLVFLWPLLAGSAVAQQAADTEAAAFPTRALKIVVPFPAGGPSDVLARMIGQKMS